MRQSKLKKKTHKKENKNKRKNKEFLTSKMIALIISQFLIIKYIHIHLCNKENKHKYIK